MDQNSQPTLPAETICQILCYLSPRDVVRLRTVSKQFHNISYLPHIWRSLYANAKLPRPPGPFPSQSVQFLQRTLLKSDRLALSWTNHPMRDISCLEIGPQNFPLDSPKVVDGRWLIGCESSRTFVMYDIDSDSVSPTRRVLYEHNQTIHDWDASSLISIDGPIVYIVFTRGPLSLWKLLEFRISNTSGQLYYLQSLDIPMRKFVQMRLHGGHGPFLYLRWHHLILDAETRELYRFPALGLELGTLPPGWRFEPLVKVYNLISKIHVFFCYPVVHGSTLEVRSMLVQAFMLPSNPSPVAGDLPLMRLSHEGIINGHFQSISIIRNSVVCPTTGGTNIRLLGQSFVEDGDLHFSCIDLMLPKHTSTEMSVVLPMKIVAQDILKVDYGLHQPFDWAHHVDASEDGYARGFLESCSRVQQPPSDCYVLRFAIDASQDECTAVVGEQLYPSKWSRIEHPFRTSHLGVNCAIGRWWYMNKWADSTLALACDIV